MRQIPTSGELCGECYYREQIVLVGWKCIPYDQYPEGHKRWITCKRLPACLRDKPQVMTEAERAAIYEEGRVAGMANVEGNYSDFTLGGRLKKWQVDPESL